MKKLLSILLTAIMLISLGAMALAYPYPTSDKIYATDFSNFGTIAEGTSAVGTSGWGVRTWHSYSKAKTELYKEEDGNDVIRTYLPDPTVAFDPNTDINLFHHGGAVLGGNANFPTDDPKLVLQFRLKVKNPDKLPSSGDFFTSNRNDSRSAMLFINKSGQVRASNVVNTQVVTTVNLAEWNTYTIIYDNQADKRTIYVNGEHRTIAEGGDLNRYGATGAKFLIGMHFVIGSTTEVLLDDLQLYKYPSAEIDYEISTDSAGKTRPDYLDIDFGMVPDSNTVTKETFTVKDEYDNTVAISSVSKYPNSKKYKMTFEENLSPNTNYTIQANGGVTFPADTPAGGTNTLTVNTTQKSFTTGSKQNPIYSITPKYTNDFSLNATGMDLSILGTNGTVKHQAAEGLIRIAGTAEELSTGYPRAFANHGTIPGHPKMVMEFRYRHSDFLNGQKVESNVLNGRSAMVSFFNGQVRANSNVDAPVIANVENNQWHTVSIVYDNVSDKRTIFVDDNPGVEVIGQNNYATAASPIFAYAFYATLDKNSYFDLDYVKVYPYPEFAAKLASPTNVDTRKVKMLFTSVPNFEDLISNTIMLDMEDLDAELITIRDAYPANEFNQEGFPVILEVATPLKNDTIYAMEFDGVKSYEGKGMYFSSQFITKGVDFTFTNHLINKSNKSSVSASVSVVNNTGKAKAGFFMVAAYTKDANGIEQMVAFDSKPITFEAGTAMQSLETNSLDLSAYSNVTIRSFLWDSNLISLTGAKEETL